MFPTPAALGGLGCQEGRLGEMMDCNSPCALRNIHPSTPGGCGALLLFGAASRGVHLFMADALAVKALSVEKNFPNSSRSHCLHLQGADGSL